MKILLDKKIHLFLQKLNIKEKNVLVGFSAGADSTALLYVLNQKKDFFGFNLSAVFFKHGNSPIGLGEDKSLSLAQETCMRMGINLFQVEVKMEKTPGESWEEIGRNERRKFYQQKEFDFVFLGHHEDDQNENTMIQLFRGAGMGITGMNEIEGKICRPFLGIEKVDIYEFLEKNKIKWQEDPTNNNIDFTRNFWRKKGLPAIEEHYKEYRKTLALFRKKQKVQNLLLLELANIDGLKELIGNTPIQIEKLSKERIINLIQFLGKLENSNLELKQIEAFLDKGNKIGAYSIETKKYTLCLTREKNQITLSKLNHKNDVSIRPTLKL